jgi:hypothetical protein
VSKENLIDHIILLLSTDWFFDYWPAIGIGIEKRKKALLQTGCRAIVKQILSTKLGPVENYYLSDFGEDRLARTRTLLLELMSRYGLDECVQEAIFSALEKKRYSNNSLDRIRVLEDITALVVEDRLNDTEAHLAEPIKPERPCQCRACRWPSVEFEQLGRCYTIFPTVPKLPRQTPQVQNSALTAQ